MYGVEHRPARHFDIVFGLVLRRIVFRRIVFRRVVVRRARDARHVRRRSRPHEQGMQRAVLQLRVREVLRARLRQRRLRDELRIRQQVRVVLQQRRLHPHVQGRRDVLLRMLRRRLHDDVRARRNVHVRMLRRWLHVYRRVLLTLALAACDPFVEAAYVADDGGSQPPDASVDVSTDAPPSVAPRIQTCPAGRLCTEDCPAGACLQTCAASSTCSYDCSGGNCTQNCATGALCTFTCAGGRCDQKCIGADCRSTCDGGGCT
jgi:hypothetical protein